MSLRVIAYYMTHFRGLNLYYHSKNCKNSFGKYRKNSILVVSQCFPNLLDHMKFFNSVSLEVY